MSNSFTALCSVPKFRYNTSHFSYCGNTIVGPPPTFGGPLGYLYTVLFIAYRKTVARY
eukprot:SAG31_NODE_2728_length_5180_cov_2.415469_7_plen_57_part_01